MACIGPKENAAEVDKAYEEVINLLLRDYKIESMPASFWTVKLEERVKRRAELKESIRRMFELDAWEGF